MNTLFEVGPGSGLVGGNMFGFELRDVFAFIVGCLIKLLGIAQPGRM